MSNVSTHTCGLEVGARLSRVRSTTGLSQAAFAASLDISPRAYQNYERGEREVPAAMLLRVYERYEIDPIWLLRGPGDEPARVTERVIDGDLLEEIVRLIEDWLIKNGATLPPLKKARAIRLAYEYCSEEGRVDGRRVADLLSLAA